MASLPGRRVATSSKRPPTSAASSARPARSRRSRTTKPSFPRKACPLLDTGETSANRHSGEKPAPLDTGPVSRVTRGGLYAVHFDPASRCYENSARPPHIVIPAKSRYPVPAPWIPVYVEASGRPIFIPLCGLRKAMVIPAKSLPRTRYGAGIQGDEGWVVRRPFRSS